MGLEGAGTKAASPRTWRHAGHDHDDVVVVASDAEGLLTDGAAAQPSGDQWPGLRDKACLRHLAGALPDQVVVGLILLSALWCWYKGSLIEGSSVKQELLVGLLLMTLAMLLAVFKVWFLRPMQDELEKLMNQNKQLESHLETQRSQLETHKKHLEAQEENNQELTRQIDDLSSVKDKLEVYGQQHNLTVNDLLEQITLGTEEQRKLRDQTKVILQHQAAIEASKRLDDDEPELGTHEEVLREVRDLLDCVDFRVAIEPGCNPRRARELMATGLRQQREKASGELGRCRRSSADALRSPPTTSRSGVSTQVPSTARQRINFGGEMSALYGSPRSPLSMESPRFWSTESERNGRLGSDASPWSWPQRQAELQPQPTSRQSALSNPGSPGAAELQPRFASRQSAYSNPGSPGPAEAMSAQSPGSCLSADSPLLSHQQSGPRQGPPGAGAAGDGSSPPGVALRSPAPVPAPRAKVSSTPRTARTGPWATLPTQSRPPSRG